MFLLKCGHPGVNSLLSGADTINEAAEKKSQRCIQEAQRPANAYDVNTLCVVLLIFSAFL